MVIYRSTQLLAMGLVAAGCGGGESPESTARNEPTFEAQAALVAGIQPATKRVRFLRHVPDTLQRREMFEPPYDFRGTPQERAWEEQRAIVARNIAGSDWPVEAAEGRLRLIYTDENNDEWEEEYDLEELKALKEVGEARGINRASSLAEGGESASPTAPGVDSQAWSYNADGRTPRPLNATFPANHNVLSRLGFLFGVGGCTATLVGRRLVLTAAHCVVDANGSVPNGTVSYQARRDDATAPFGTSFNDATWVDSRYTLHNCQTNYTTVTRETCGKYDWALLRVPDAQGSQAWMGYWVPPTVTEGWYVWNVGYPACGGSDSPAGCVPARAYGETVGHTTVDHRGTVDGELTVFNGGVRNSV